MQIDSRCQWGINPPLWRFPYKSINCIWCILFGLFKNAHLSRTSTIHLSLTASKPSSYNDWFKSWMPTFRCFFLFDLSCADGLSFNVVFCYLIKTCDILDFVVIAWPDLDCAKVLCWRNLLSEGGPQSAQEDWDLQLGAEGFLKGGTSHQTAHLWLKKHGGK